MIEKSSVTGIVDIDPNNKLIKIFPNPLKDGNFIISFTGFTPIKPVDVSIVSEAGQLVWGKQYKPGQTMNAGRPMAKGVYHVKINTEKGITVKTLVVR